MSAWSGCLPKIPPYTTDRQKQSQKKKKKTLKYLTLCYQLLHVSRRHLQGICWSASKEPTKRIWMGKRVGKERTLDPWEQEKFLKRDLKPILYEENNRLDNEENKT